MLASAKRKPTMTSLPSFLKRELQTLVSVNCKEVVLRGKSATKKQQCKMLENCHHGTEDVDSMLDKLLEGEVPFD